MRTNRGSKQIDSTLCLAFDGFPYISTRLAPPIYHVILLPQDQSIDRLRVMVHCQAKLNGLLTCLALADDCGIYYDAEGFEETCMSTPQGGIIAFGGLKPLEKFTGTEELLLRATRLKAFADQHNPPGGCAFGDLTKGGRPASEDELVRLPGSQANGVPKASRSVQSVSNGEASAWTRVQSSGAR